MLTKSDIVKYTNKKSFERGQLIAQNTDNIFNREVIHLEDANEIHASVVSASGWNDSFRSSIVTDADYNNIVDFECNCPAYSRFDRMCKHCVALSLTFIEDPQSFARFNTTYEKTTAKSITAFVDQVTPDSFFGKKQQGISIKVHLIHNFGNWSATFKLESDNVSYVMQSPKDFANALKNGSFVSYGKKLGFAHTLDAFDDSSKKIADVILRAIELRQNIDRSIALKERNALAKKELDLTDFEVVDLLNAIGETPFDYSDLDIQRDYYNLVVKVEDPEFMLRIIEENDGFEIIRDEEFSIAAFEDTMYFFREDEVYKCSTTFAKAAPFLQNVYLSGNEDLYIANEDASLFAASVLPILKGALPISIPDKLEKLIPVEGTIAYYFDLIRVNKKEYITAEVRVNYGEESFTLMESSDPEEGITLANTSLSDKNTEAEDGRNLDDKLYRFFDVELEQKAISALQPYFTSTMILPLEDVDVVGDLLYGGLKALQSVGEVFTTPAFDRLLLSRSPNVQIGLSVSGNLLNMDIQPTDIERDELNALLKSYKRKKKYHRLKDGSYISLAEAQVKQFADMAQDLGLTPDDILSGKIHLPAYRAFLIDREYANANLDESFNAYIDSFTEIDQSKYKLPHGLKAKLRPYQVEGFRWLSALSELGFGGILADEMGLGKTIQVITLILSQIEQKHLDNPVLIICPASLVYNWVDEFNRFAPSINVCAIEGQKIDRMKIRRDSNAQVYICSYDIARIDWEEFEKGHFSFIFLDEAQYIKNHATKTTRAIKKLHCDHRFALTGTPIENRLSEIWSIFDFLMPGFLGSYAYFMTRYESDIIGGDENTASRLQSLVGPFVLRRLKRDVLLDLPDKMESVIHVPLVGEQKKLYDANEQNLRENLNIQKRNNASRAHRAGLDSANSKNNIEVLAELMRLRQIALDPALVYDNYKGQGTKIDVIIELIEQAMNAGQKTLVFSQFTSYLNILKKALAKRDIGFFEITGKTSKAKRLEYVNEFNQDDTPVFLVSLKAGGTGLNLTGASIVIHADPWWNAAATNQATDRAHRIGQEKNVMVYKIIAKDTIEDRIEQLQRKKSDLADSIIKQVDASSLSSLTKDELQYLLNE